MFKTGLSNKIAKIGSDEIKIAKSFINKDKVISYKKLSIYQTK